MSDLALSLIMENRRQHEAGNPACKRLDLGYCGLREIPEEVFENTWIEELILSNTWEEFMDPKLTILTGSKNQGGKNKLSIISRKIECFTNLQVLKMGGWGSVIVWQIQELENLPESLIHLDLCSNQIKNIQFVERLTKLKFLNLSVNQIININPLRELTSLQYLKLQNNQINNIDVLNNLTHLKVLDLSINHISRVDGLINLTELEVLNLRRNRISDLTPIVNLLKRSEIQVGLFNLDGISLGENRILIPPSEIVYQGRDAVLNWFEQIEEGEEPLFETKLMILGQGEAGKTTFAELQLKEDYEVVKGKIDSTLGVIIHKGKPFRHIARKNVSIKAHLWDFGGQDIQKMLHQFFITENCLYVLVSDKRAENTNFDYWFQIINLLGPKSCVIVLENPINIKVSNEDFPLNKYRELYPNLTIERVEVNLCNTRTTDKTKWRLLNETIEKKLSELEIVNRPVPKKWTLVREELEKLHDKKYISKDDFYKLCSSPTIGLTHRQADLSLFYMRLLGDLEYFDDRDLCDIIFLDHNWLTKGLYYILSDKQIQESKGRFTRQQAYRQWDIFGYNEAEKSMLLRLLLKDKFDICYELKNEKDVFITPLLLPTDKLEKWEHKTNLHFRYQYNFMPHGIFSRLIVRIHEKIDREQRWKTGVRLVETDNGNKIYAEAQEFTDPEQNHRVIDIKLNGDKDGCKKLLNFIRNEIEDVHKDFKSISVKRIVGCNCDNCMRLIEEGNNPSFYDFDKLLSKIQIRKYFEECPNSKYQEINIGQILNDVIIENAANENIDRSFIETLKQMGMTINQIKNEYNPSFTNTVNATSSSSSNAEATTTIEFSMEIRNILGETENLKEDILSDLKIENVPEKEIKYAINDVEKFEKALKEADEAKNKNHALPAKTGSRLERFWNDVGDEKSNLHKALKAIRKGKDYCVRLAEIYNNIPGVPSIPPIVLDVVKKL